MLSTRRLCAAVAAVVFLAAVVACSGPATTQQGPEPRAFPSTTAPTQATVAAAFDWSKAGTKTKVGDVEIELLWAGTHDYDLDGGGNRVRSYCGTVLQFRLTNTSAVKVREFEGWSNQEVELMDEHGNKFDLTSSRAAFIDHPIPEKENKHRNTLEWPHLVGSITMHPSRSYGTYLIFQMAPKPSKELRFTAKAAVLGGDGEIRFRTPLTYRSADCDRPRN